MMVSSEDGGGVGGAGSGAGASSSASGRSFFPIQHHLRLALDAWYVWLTAARAAQATPVTKRGVVTGSKLMLLMCVLEESWHLVAFYNRIYRLLSTIQPDLRTSPLWRLKSAPRRGQRLIH